MLSKGFAAALFLIAPLAQASTVVYNVTIDTSSQSGNNGAIYFQFAGGLNADLASATINPFSIGAPGGLSATPSPFSDGGVTGSLDSLPLIIDNSGGLNDYEHYLVYGSNLTFRVTFNLPSALTGSSGSELLWQLTADDGITPILTQDASGFIGTISYDTSANFTVDTLGNDSIETIQSAQAPEPASMWLTAGAALLLLLAVRATSSKIPRCRCI